MTTALDRIRRNVGADLLRVLMYPGGAGALFRDLMRAEHRLDLMLERASFAKRVLNGEADNYVEAALREDQVELCDHCKDLAARVLRAARDRAERQAKQADEQLMRLHSIIRRSTVGHGLRHEDAFSHDAIARGLARFFQVIDPATEVDHG